MPEEPIKDGAFQVARQLFYSELWQTKPASWNMIWIYILGNVNHEDNRYQKRGFGFFNFSMAIKKRWLGPSISLDMVKSFLQYARKMQMIDTHQTTRGTTLEVLKYNTYQNMNNYKNTPPTTLEPLLNHSPTTSINKNVRMKEEKIRLPVAPRKKKEPDLRLELKCRVFLTAYNFHFYSHFDTPATLLSGMAFWEQTLPLEKMIQGMMFMEKSWFGGTRTPTPEQMFQRHNRNNEPVNHFEAALNDGRTHLDWEADHRKIMTHLKSTKEYQDYERTLQLGAGLPVQAGVVNHPDRPTNQEADARLETVSGETTGSTGNRSVVQTGDS